MSGEDLLPFVDVAEVEVEGDDEPVGEGAVEVNFDLDVWLVTTVGRLLRLGPWLPCPMEKRESFAERLATLGKSLKGYEKLYRAKGEENRKLTEKQGEWELRCQALMGRIGKMTRQFEEMEVELERVRVAPAEEERRTPCSAKEMKEIGVQTRTAQVEVVVQCEEESEGLGEADAGGSVEGGEGLENGADPERLTEVMQQVMYWEMRCKLGEERLEMAQSEQEEEIQKMEEEHAEEVARIRREYEMELEELRRSPVQPEADAQICEEEVEPSQATSQNFKGRASRDTAGVRKGEKRKHLSRGKERKRKVLIAATSSEESGTPVRRSLRGQSSNPSTAEIASNPIIKPSVLAKAWSNRAPSKGLEMRKASSTGPFKCRRCGSRLSSLKNLRRHEKQIHEEPVRGRFKCTKWYCLKRFSSNHYLQIHLKAHAENELFKCPTCGKKLATKQSYEHHLETHESNRRRDFNCSTCFKSYFTQTDLTQHKKIHRPGRPFRCPQCPQRFKSNHELQLHSVVHSERRPYSCEFCDKSFRRQNELVLHLRVHTGERPFSCKICEKTFSRSSHLSNHVRRIHAKGRVEKERPFKCPVCGVGFTRKWSCEKHQQDRHPMRMAPSGSGAETTRRSRRLQKEPK